MSLSTGSSWKLLLGRQFTSETFHHFWFFIIFSRVDRSENDLNLDHFYFGVHLDKVLDLPPAARGKQIEAELKLSETFKNETTQHEKQKTLKVIGPDCSFASSFYYNLKTAEDILLKFEFTADTLLGEEEFDSFTITSENMKQIIDDPKNVFHLDAECPEKSKIKAKSKWS